MTNDDIIKKLEELIDILELMKGKAIYCIVIRWLRFRTRLFIL